MEGANLESVRDPRTRRVGWGILGTGRITSRLVRAVRASDRGWLAAVASRDAGRAHAFATDHEIPTGLGSYAALLERPDVDVVYVALPNHLHAEWSVRALEAGKHVLCEKPLALTVADADAIVAASERTGRVAVEAFMYLHHPQIRMAIERARAGAIGKLELVRGSFSFLLTYPNDPRIDPAMGGGSIWDVGCYPVSFSRRLAGEEPIAVSAFARFDEQGVDRTFVGQLRFPGGLLAQFDCGFAAPDRQAIEIVGTGGSILLGAPFLTAPDGPPPSVVIRPGGEEVEGTTGEPTAVPVEAVDQYRLEVEDLMRVVLDGAEPLVDLAFSSGNVATLVELDRAAREGIGSLTAEARG